MAASRIARQPGAVVVSPSGHGGPVDARPRLVTSPDGTPIACWTTGAGQPLVLVHGTAADHSRWAPVLPALSERFTVIAIDRRGRGGSGDGDGGYAIEREFDDLAAVVAWAGAGSCLLGHSYGAVCALEAAFRADGVRALVLYEPSMGQVGAPADVIDRLETLLDAGRRDDLLRYFMQAVAGATPEQVELMRARPAWEARLRAAHTIPRELRADEAYALDPSRAGGFGVPTLVLRGGDSPAAFGVAAEVLQAALPAVRTAVMPGQGHVAMDTGTALFTAEVLKFLDDAGA